MALAVLRDLWCDMRDGKRRLNVARNTRRDAALHGEEEFGVRFCIGRRLGLILGVWRQKVLLETTVCAMAALQEATLAALTKKPLQVLRTLGLE